MVDKLLTYTLIFYILTLYCNEIYTTQEKLKMAINLDKYKQETENGFQDAKSVKKDKQLEILKNAAAKHSKNKKSITIRIANHDLEEIKIKASKLGLAYQTYINMLLHQAAPKI